MASSPLRAPAAAGQQQSRLMDMQKKFQQRHLATVAAVKSTVGGSTTSSTTSSTKTTGSGDLPVPPVRRIVGAIAPVQPQPQQRRPVGSGSGGDSVLQVDVKGKVRQLFAERSQQLQGPGYQHHQQQRRQRRRSLTGRDRSRPLRPLSGADDDPLCKTVCFTAGGGADLVGISAADGGDVRSELLALFGRLPNLGGQLLSESFRGGAGKMKTAQSAPELKWLLDGSNGPGRAGGAQRPPQPPAAGPDKGGGIPKRAAAGRAGDAGDYGDGNGDGSADDDGDGDNDQRQQLQRPAARINSKTATVVKKPLATVNGNVGGGGGGGGGGGVGRVAKKATSNDSNRLLLPPVVQPTVINALAAGAGAAAAVASVTAAREAGIQKPLVRAAKLPQKPAAARRVSPLPAKAAPRPPVVKRATPTTPTTGSPRPQPLKQQLSADRGPPAKGMARCPLCARDFAADRLPKHEQVCRRTRDRDRKRKVFDTSKKRLEAVAAEAGVDVTSFKKKSQKEDQRVAEKLQKKKDAWRRKHDQLLRNVRAARAVQRHLAAGGTVKDLPPELENATADQDDEIDSDLVKCPHCGRTFNEASAERHMPLCADRQRNAAARMQNNKKR
ncbi:uncharacterized protein LOC111032988 isoform X2 [Myzus persicae]|uniref:uncharacterized protein LOC111032988 isoform X2 n=1 Tax=Myzus persicae TaxID=13164 RepID=UPI000B9332B7|nr:uncharacterized protein LOC111032988 isoform X2 [Myzus persicae]